VHADTKNQVNWLGVLKNGEAKLAPSVSFLRRSLPCGDSTTEMRQQIRGLGWGQEN
jgi:hypothetical protein